MVKNLADELSNILDWVENPGLGDHAHEEAQMGLVIFCRGLVVGLRASEPMDKQIDGRLRTPDEALKDCGRMPDCH